jgi:hypothetical protein
LELPQLAEIDSDLAAEVASLKSRLPDASELASLAARLQLQGIDVAPAPAAAAKPVPRINWAFGGAGVIAVGLGLWALGPPKPASRQAFTPAVPSAPAAATAPGADAPAPGSAASKVSSRTDNEPEPVIVPDGTPASAHEMPMVATSGLPPALPLAERVGLPSPVPSNTSEPRTPSPSVTGVERGHGVAPGAAPTDASTPTEIELLRDARLAIKRSPAAALDLTEQHTRTYPSGKLLQERELIAISALVALGRRTAALSRAARFERAFPQSPYRKQLAGLLQ